MLERSAIRRDLLWHNPLCREQPRPTCAMRTLFDGTGKLRFNQAVWPQRPPATSFVPVRWSLGIARNRDMGPVAGPLRDMPLPASKGQFPPSGFDANSAAPPRAPPPACPSRSTAPRPTQSAVERVKSENLHFSRFQSPAVSRNNQESCCPK